MLHRISLLLVALFMLAACGAQPSAQPPAEPAATVDQQPAAAEPTSAPEPASAPEPTSAPTTAAVAEAGALSVVDGTGVTISLSEPPTKILCLTSNCIDILADLGVEPYAVLTADCDPLARLPDFFGDRAANFQQIGGGWFEPSIEEVIAAQPDLIIGHPMPHSELYGMFEETAPLYNVHQVESIDDAKQNLLDIGTLLGREEAAQAAIERFDQRMAELAAAAPQNVSAVVIEGSDVNVSTFVSESTIGQLLGPLMQFGVNAPEGVDIGFGAIPFSLEKLLETDPDVIFVHTVSWEGPVDPLPQQFAQNPVWAQMQAVQTGRVYEVDGKIWHNNNGLRSFVITVEQALATVYPEVFQDRPGLTTASN